MAKPPLFDDALNAAQSLRPGHTAGRVEKVDPLLVKAHLPHATMGELVLLGPARGTARLKAEVVAVRDDKVLLAPLGSTQGISREWEAHPTGAPMAVTLSESLLGRVIDGLGEPMDDGGPIPGGEDRPLIAPPPHPLKRRPITEPFVTGVRAIDTLLTLGKGQRVGLFAGSGVGKSTLMGMIAREARADVIVVCLVGERGREVNEFLTDSLGPEGLERSVVVVSTSDSPALVRAKAPLTATAVAEYFRDRGLDVLLFIDSLTRFSRDEREIALSLGEPPARRGFPPSVFARLPALLERAGNGEQGSITAIYTVLVEGGDMEEPVTDEVRGIVDGHILLSRTLAALGHFPAIDVPGSVSRVMGRVTTAEHRADAAEVKGLIAALEKSRDLLRVGAYEPGGDPQLDRAVQKSTALEAFLCQSLDDTAPFEDHLARLTLLVKA